MTSTLHHKAPGSGEPPGPWHRWSGIATVLGTVIGGLGLIVALLAWLLPRQNDPAPTPTTTTPATATQATATQAGTTSATTPAAPAVFLDAGSVAVEAGKDRLVDMPRAIRGKNDYASHSLIISCPSNQTGDQTSDVTFVLNGHYVQFDAEVHPYYPPGADQQSVTYVTARTGVRQKDTSLTTTDVARQANATSTAAKPLTATVDKAEKLTLRVQCADPGGTIVLTNARLTPA
ncbi:hypothetical protein [Actinoplanes sp. NPDC026619]|uniref:hypothetical protein n=1 Tax=Actinoplanes sp. NPDC026619 TaxID=3155798 RepID=UPI0034102950